MRTCRIALLAGLFFLVFAVGAQTQTTSPDPTAVRQAALNEGLGSLRNVQVPKPDLDQFLNPGPAAQAAARILGKALFWDMQVGSDGQACGSCHFHAGADNRAKNQLNPGLAAATPDTVFGNPAVGATGFPQFGPNYTLTATDFPFHQLLIPEQRSFLGRQVLRDTNDIASSQGVFKAVFGSVGGATDQGTPVADDIFKVLGINVRRIEPRNTPSMINAVFNFDNFWDGRAKNRFNGVSPFGELDDTARILVNDPIFGLQAKKVLIPNSSLASQAVGPPLSPNEMSFVNRTFTNVGEKMVGIARGARLLPLQPLALQRVHRQDSVLGPFSADPLAKGLTVASYAALVQAAFQPQYWDSLLRVTLDSNGNFVILTVVLPGQQSFSQMEANFSLFMGLSVQLYESTLVSDQTRFDQFMDGNNAALSPDELRGLLVFMNRGTLAQQANPIFAGVGQGACAACHSGPELTEAAFTSRAREGLIELDESTVMNNGLLAQDAQNTVFEDVGFANIGVRPTAEDIARGGTAFGKPLSFTRQALAGFPLAPPLPPCGFPNPPCPINNRQRVDGAFKIPGLRNVELTGPYFHNGGQATLSEVIKFYERQGDFGDVNLPNIEDDLAAVRFSPADEPLLRSFLLALTDPRVRNEAGPFDHPEIFVPNGHPGDQNVVTCFLTASNGVNVACDDRITIPAIGSNGRSAEGLPPLGTFLNLAP